MLLIAGLIGGTIALVVVLLFAWLGIFHNSGGIGILGGALVLILVGAIPGILIGLKVFRRFEKEASSRSILIVDSAFFGIAGGAGVAIAVTLCFVLSWVHTFCC